MINKVKIMGILNITSDSFYDGTDEISLENNESRLNKIISSDIIDVGCESSRPGSSPVPLDVEISRLSTFIPLVKKYSDKIFSIDTYKYEVAKIALENGFSVINDITAGSYDNKIYELASSSDSEIVLMHMQGTPKTMQDNPSYGNIIDDLLSFFENKVELALKSGIKEDKIIIDPGIGFGKTLNDNDLIVKNIGRLKEIGFRLLVGISRKSFLQFDNDDPKDRLPASLGVTALLADKGVDIVRVHDVSETRSMLNSVERILSCK